MKNKEIVIRLIKTLIDILGVKVVNECWREAWMQKEREDTDKRMGR